jgi:trehalose synthase
MLAHVDVGEGTLASYRGVAPDPLLDAVARTAQELRGARVLHLNATPYGGGVSELLHSVVPLLNDQGLTAHWRIISGDDPFFQVTKALHNGLQGAPRELDDKEKARYLATSRANAAGFEDEYDFIFVHDPQPAAFLQFAGKGKARWIWRSHIDTSRANPGVWHFLRPFLADYDAAVFTTADFVPLDLPTPVVEIIPPAIDPQNPKNLPLPEQTARQILEWIGIHSEHPLVTQVSRFDPWKDPLGVIEAYRMVRQDVPELQLALVGSMATDDPEGWEMYRQIRSAIDGDKRIHIFTNLIGVGNVEVNAFQALSRLVIQKSLREGFGLSVSEALWKGTPVVAGRVGGIPLQMADGTGGILVDSVAECAQAMLALLQDPDRAAALGASGRERVRRHFLIPRMVLDELALMRRLELGAARGRGRAFECVSHRDPVCGMAVEAAVQTSSIDGLTLRFCSERCRTAFAADPARYLPAMGAMPAIAAIAPASLAEAAPGAPAH